MLEILVEHGTLSTEVGDVHRLCVATGHEFFRCEKTRLRLRALKESIGIPFAIRVGLARTFLSFSVVVDIHSAREEYLT